MLTPQIVVVGLWHLGCVTAACLAELGCGVTGVDEDKGLIAGLRQGQAPLHEPGLNELIRKNLAAGRLNFGALDAAVFADADVIWYAYDTPVDENDQADIAWLEQRLHQTLPHAQPGARIILSSQVPAGFTRTLETWHAQKLPGKEIYFAYAPENLRLGNALEVFLNPDRIVIGLRHPEQQPRFSPIFSRITSRLEWMRIESAEMTKHGINAYLANSIAFINELARVCEPMGADIREVSRGMKTDSRIGSKAYVNAGAAFAGGTLARDIQFLIQLGQEQQIGLSLIPAIQSSNDQHQHWSLNRCLALWGQDGMGRKLAVLGLTYKPNTSTLRRSWALELCCELVRRGFQITAYDPLVRELPPEAAVCVTLVQTPVAAMEQAVGVVLATGHTMFKQLSPEMSSALKGKIVIDPNGFWREAVQALPEVRYYAVGVSSHAVD